MLRLRELRKEKEITMKQLGEMINVSESAISQYETGKRMPDYTVLQQFAKIFNVSIDYLTGNSDIKKMPAGFPTDINQFEKDIARAGFPVEEFKALSPEDQKIALDNFLLIIKGLANKNK